MMNNKKETVNSITIRFGTNHGNKMFHTIKCGERYGGSGEEEKVPHCYVERDM